MALRQYVQPVERAKEEYCAMLRRRRRREERAVAGAKNLKIQDNSEPWNPRPQTLEDLVEIAQQVQRMVDKWGPRS